MDSIYSVILVIYFPALGTLDMHIQESKYSLVSARSVAAVRTALPKRLETSK